MTTRLSRRKRFERDSAHPPGMRLTARDVQILRAVHAFRLLTTSQIGQLLFAPTTASICARRLRLLFHHGHLARFPAPVSPVLGVQAAMIVHRLSRKGATLLAGTQGVDSKDFRFWGQHADRHHLDRTAVSTGFLQHTLRVNDTRIAIVRATQQCHLSLLEWRDEAALRGRLGRDSVSIRTERGQITATAIIPDAYFVLATPQKAHFFLEVDQGTESASQWKRKISAYARYTRSGQYQRRYHTTSLRVLVVTTSAARAAHLMAATEAATVEKYFWFTTMEQLLASNLFVDPIWLKANDGSARSRKSIVDSSPRSGSVTDAL